jgi:hypothetical protein
LKKLDFPLVDDLEQTTVLSENDGLYQTSYPHLRNRLNDVLACYHSYCEHEGNALLINSLGLEDPLKSGLKSNYSSPPNSLSYIEEIRLSSPRVCPMCGSLKPSTLDHILPKEDYAEYAIYSRNLVPACDCNIKRGRTLIDRDASERVLHPYFDSCLTQRLLSCEISPDPTFPMVEIRIKYLASSHLHAGNVRFHTENIVLRAGLLNWLTSQWSSAVDYPSAVIQTLPHSLIASAWDMQLALEDALARNDRSLGTPNNWQSIFVHGLLASPDALEWLRLKHNSEYE